MLHSFEGANNCSFPIDIYQEDNKTCSSDEKRERQSSPNTVQTPTDLEG
jgi:hypothetical protein